MYKPKYDKVASYLDDNRAKSAEVSSKEVLISVEDVEIILDEVLSDFYNSLPSTIKKQDLEVFYIQCLKNTQSKDNV